VLGRTSAPYGRSSTLPHLRLRYAGNTPVARGVAAAVIAVVTLIAAANAGPARASDAPAPPPHARHAGH
jgi:hypothetical protein